MNLLDKLATIETAEMTPEQALSWRNAINHKGVTYLRKMIGFRQDDVAKKLGIPRAHVIAIEAGTMPIPAGYRGFLIALRDHARQPWGYDTNAMSFTFINTLNLFSEWVIDGEYHTRYLVAQTKAKMMLDPNDEQMDIHFGIFCTDGETAEPTGPFRGNYPQSVREAEEQLKQMGAEKIATYPAQELLSDADMDAPQEGAQVSIAAILNGAFKKLEDSKSTKWST